MDTDQLWAELTQPLVHLPPMPLPPPGRHWVGEIHREPGDGETDTFRFSWRLEPIAPGD